MTPEQALDELEKRIPVGTTLSDALTRFVEHYAATEIEGCPKESEGDMLLFEWGGPYPWDEFVSVSLTRQFSFNDENGEYDQMRQLHMRCRYDARQVSFSASNEWLRGDDIDAFLQFVLSAPCTKTVGHLPMQSLSFDLHDV